MLALNIFFCTRCVCGQVEDDCTECIHIIFNINMHNNKNNSNYGGSNSSPSRSNTCENHIPWHHLRKLPNEHTHPKTNGRGEGGRGKGKGFCSRLLERAFYLAARLTRTDACLDGLNAFIMPSTGKKWKERVEGRGELRGATCCSLIFIHRWLLR